ncbi:MAG: ATP-binding cassette domain-containing protein [Candidatus Krumholzibacteria bacterium]|jgi:oligopeptide/dipeptide ABC transporter ATP-binding protein|nr:ATP-binding cassette domain-containing protein [Candidatus Krumholzibacteria bacterium]MDP6668707.1 ATP-binding cassette domain-containing protein [Candidatus Krumholzibacteria bacterium]MDP6797229.1 ATP-binding cassette domain-containing protein [Candidatus Krumholzibacteria bacterium]MDP7022390.1 ATP-binding cassette domain-containing protein [Candidatus Krumholzibacteria bacterium]
MSKTILSVKDLKVYYPIFGGVMLRKVAEVKAVDGVDFELIEGETLGLVGESGCGKSTVGRSILNVLWTTAPDVEISGEINFHRDDQCTNLVGLNRKKMKPFRTDLQMIFQDPYSSLNPRMTVGQIIEEPLKIHKKEMGRAERMERVGWLLDKVGLSAEQSNRYPHEFSGGQRQRIGFARALATNPKVIIADEPVSALDVSIQAQVINLLKELQNEFGLTYLFIAHDLSVVEHISDRIAVMYLGNIVEIGAAKDVYFNPSHPYSKALLSAVPLPDPDRAEKGQRIVLKGDVPTPINKPSGCAFRTRCPIAREECAGEVPKLKEVSPGHFAACPYHEEMKG